MPTIFAWGQADAEFRDAPGKSVSDYYYYWFD